HRKQIDLRVVEYGLYPEKREKSDRNVVETRTIPRDKCCIEQASNDLWKRESDSDAEQETEKCARELDRVGADAGKQGAQWLRIRETFFRLCLCHQIGIFRSAAIATKRRARYSNEYL